MPPRPNLNTHQQHLETKEMNALLLPSGIIALAGLQFFVIVVQLFNSARRAAEDPILYPSQSITTTTTTIPLQIFVATICCMIGLALRSLSGRDVNRSPITFVPNQETQARLKSLHNALRRENSKDLVGLIACIAGTICELYLINTQLIERHSIILGVGVFLIRGSSLLQVNGLFAREDQYKITAVERLIRNSQFNVQDENPLLQDNQNQNLNRNVSH